MGTKLAQSCACLFTSHFQDTYVYTYPLQPFLWKSYTDDIHLIWTNFFVVLDYFIIHLSRCHPAIKFTQEVSLKGILFLDLLIKISHKTPHKALCQSTGRHMYLRYDSEHPKSLRDSIPYSQFLR